MTEDLDNQIIYRMRDGDIYEGDIYEGEIFESDKGKLFGEVEVACSQCGGSGRWSKNRRKSCLGCDGEGTKFEQVPLYDPEKWDKLVLQREKARIKREVAQEEWEKNRKQKYDVFTIKYADLIAEAKQSNTNFVRNLLEGLEKYGEWTFAQIEALQNVLQQKKATTARFQTSEAIAEEGERIDTEVECLNVKTFLHKKFKGRGMEELFLTSLSDSNNNALMVLSSSFKMDVGSFALIRGTVKEVKEYDGYLQTRLNRVSVLDHILEFSSQNSPRP